jgi:GNAT superfamily N-acetyltransferase
LRIAADDDAMKFAAAHAMPLSPAVRNVACDPPWQAGERVMADPKHYAVKETLKDGTVVTIRAARPGDEDKIRCAFRNLEPETVYTRFFAFKNEVTDAELARITSADFDRDVALLVTIGSGDTEIVIGGASYFSTDAAAPERSAEIAFTVEEDYQGLGIAGSLMRHLVRIARETGFARLEADVLARNLPMLSVFRRSGLPMTLRHDDGTVHLTMALQPETE